MPTVTVLRRDGDWTVDDLRDLPDDGLQYELADGVLLVSPSPRPAHQRAVVRLLLLLQASCPPHLEVFVAPLDFQPTRRRSLQPDVLVVRRDEIGELALERRLELAVEVLLSTHARVQTQALFDEGTDTTALQAVVLAITRPSDAGTRSP